MMKDFAQLALVGLFLGGCTLYRPIAVSTNPVGTMYERPIDTAHGVSTKYYIPFLFWFNFGDNSIEAAWKNALEGKGGDTLSNVFVERKTLYFIPFVVQSETNVSGTVVKYDMPPKKENVEKPEPVTISKPEVFPIEPKKIDKPTASEIKPVKSKSNKEGVPSGADTLEREFNRPFGR